MLHYFTMSRQPAMSKTIDYNRFSDILASPYENEEFDPSWAVEPRTYQVAQKTTSDVENAQSSVSAELPRKPEHAIIARDSTSTVNDDSSMPRFPSSECSERSSNTSISDIQKEKDQPPPLPDKHGSTLTRYLAREYKLRYKVFDVEGLEVPFVLLQEV